MPPCEPLTTTAPAASPPMRVMLSPVRTGGSSFVRNCFSARKSSHDAEKTGDRPRRPRHRGELARLLPLAGGAGALGWLLPIVFPLFLAPSRPLLGIERAVVIGVDLVEAIVIELVELLGGHCRQPVVIGLAPLEGRLLGRGQARRRQPVCEPRLALLQIAHAELPILVKGDHFLRGRGLGGSLRGGRPLPPSPCEQSGRSRGNHPSSHRDLLTFDAPGAPSEQNCKRKTRSSNTGFGSGEEALLIKPVIEMRDELAVAVPFEGRHALIRADQPLRRLAPARMRDLRVDV